MKTKSIKQMEAQFNRVCKWCFTEIEMSDAWVKRLTHMAAVWQRYRKNAYEYVWALRGKGYTIWDETTYPVPVSTYAKRG